MGSEFKSGLMVQSIKAIGSRTEPRVRAFFGMQMETSLKANSKMISQTDTVSTRAQTALSTKVCGSTIFSTAKAQLLGLMVRLTRVTTLKERSMALVHTSGSKGIVTVVSGLIIK